VRAHVAEKGIVGIRAAVQQNLFVMVDELSGLLNDEQKERFERMKAKINDLTTLILTWLRVLSVDVQKIQENFKPTSVSTVISKAIESVQPNATRKDVQIIFQDQGPFRPVNGDEGTLVETIVNLLGNAIKYSRTGSEITIKVIEIEDSLSISVADTGIGISKEDLPYIFNDFYTGKDGQKVEKSTGLGLAICRRIIEAHHGSISVESELGKGSTFSIQLPVLVSEML
jgi:signal transduction histidine kinase